MLVLQRPLGASRGAQPTLAKLFSWMKSCREIQYITQTSAEPLKLNREEGCPETCPCPLLEPPYQWSLNYNRGSLRTLRVAWSKSFISLCIAFSRSLERSSPLSKKLPPYWPSRFFWVLHGLRDFVQISSRSSSNKIILSRTSLWEMVVKGYKVGIT